MTDQRFDAAQALGQAEEFRARQQAECTVFASP